MQPADYEASLLETIHQLEADNAGLHLQIEETKLALAQARRVENALLNRMNSQSEVITMLEESNISGQKAHRLPQIQAKKSEWIRSHKISTKRLLQRPAI